jgi:predicted TIM-barrel fold metal-dependent hydrolase
MESGTTAVKGRRYRLVSADSHVNEPPGLWVDRVPARFKERAPHVVHLDAGDAWIIEGAKEPITFGMNACAGLEPTNMKAWLRFEDIRTGGWDPAARVKEMDQDGVDAEVLYPTPRLSAGILANLDADYHHAMVRAYNDWLCEYASYAPERFGGMAILPNRGVEPAIEEMERVLDVPGIRGMVMGCYPHGTLEIDPEDDKVWARLAERNTPLNIHVMLTQAMPAEHKTKLPGYGRFYDAPNRMIDLIFAGVFDRYPELDVVFAEVDFGWVPYVTEQIDNNYQRLEPVSQFGLQALPSEYIHDHFHFGYMTDTFGLRSLDYVGAERVLWSNDYPHISADWPYSWRTIQAAFTGVSPHDKHLVLCGNAQRLYHFE